jgi:hypothetical protein
LVGKATGFRDAVMPLTWHDDVSKRILNSALTVVIRLKPSQQMQSYYIALNLK